MTKRLATDWRLWAGLALAVLLALAGVIASEYPRVAAIRKLRRTGWTIHRDGIPLASYGAFIPTLQPPRLLRVESRLPMWILSDAGAEWQHEWFVRALAAEVTDYANAKFAPPDLRGLEPLHELRTLEVKLFRSHAWNAKPIGNLSALESVVFWIGDTMTVTEIEPLEKLSGLKRVNLRAPDFDDEALDALSQMTHLEELTIYSPGVTQRLSPAITVLQSQKHVTLRVGDDQQ